MADPAYGRRSVLYVTDLSYQARGRCYRGEDLMVSARLRDDFDVALCHPLDARRLMGGFDGVLVRNSGPVLHYREEYDAFRSQAMRHGTRVFNPLTGKGDMVGKGYLLELTAQGSPVIPTVQRRADLDLLPVVSEYVVKPTYGADSVGLEVVSRRVLDDMVDGDVLVQPRIDFAYEVSFYFVDRTFRYALCAPRPEARWELEWYEPTSDDLAFAQHFVDWNSIDHGIQRVDACRTADGELLLVELEDLNPYLSLEVVDEETRAAFVAALSASLHRLLIR